MLIAMENVKMNFKWRMLITVFNGASMASKGSESKKMKLSFKSFQFQQKLASAFKPLTSLGFIYILKMNITIVKANTKGKVTVNTFTKSHSPCHLQ